MSVNETPRRVARPPASQVRPDTPIWCRHCRVTHPAIEFAKNASKFSGLATYCKAATRERARTPEGRVAASKRAQRRWESVEYQEKSRAWQQARRTRLGANHDLKRARARLKSIVDAWKASGCVDCGYSDVRALDPDHLDPATKLGNLSRMVQLCASEARIRAELAKCVVRCARCHRRRTFERPAKNRQARRLPPSWARIIAVQDWSDAMKIARGCSDCGWNSWARGMDWDHVAGDKVAAVSQLIARNRPWSEVEMEIGRCEAVCVNCHRIRTAKRRAVALVAAVPVPPTTD